MVLTGVLYGKPDGKSVRMVTDFTRLNSFVQRPVHPFACVSEILQTIPASAKYFAKMDAVNGYFQIALDEESSMKTTFLLPSGRYRYLRIPQGLNASSDEWCRRSDAIIDGLPWAKKIVDDVLVWAPNLKELEARVSKVAQNCKDLNIILSRKKLAVGTTLPFAGYIVSSDGVRPDPERVEAIQKFPAPKNLTGVRSFLGLAQQLSFFIPDFSHATTAMRQFLGKLKVFRWLPEHEQEFQTLKTILSASLLTKHFDPNRKVTLLTDASRHNGMGFALCQENDGKHVIITCVSKSFTPAQQRYATQFSLDRQPRRFSAFSGCPPPTEADRGKQVTLVAEKPIEGI